MSYKKNLIPADEKIPFFALVISVNIAQLFTFHRHIRRVVWWVYESGDKPQLTISYFVMQHCSRAMQMYKHTPC